MKKTLFISVLTSLSFLSFTMKEEKEIYGTWTGGFGNESVITHTTVELKQHNKADVYEGTMDESNKVTGEYEVRGDTAFILSYHQPCTNKKMVLQGNINRSKNFVDGVWQSATEVKGSFYLQKQSR